MRFSGKTVAAISASRLTSSPRLFSALSADSIARFSLLGESATRCFFAPKKSRESRSRVEKNIYRLRDNRSFWSRRQKARESLGDLSRLSSPQLDLRRRRVLYVQKAQESCCGAGGSHVGLDS
ncbi:unnamed protein product [Trichogramma brassicae]|uniref:Uncharacterized protein n=1 Tax=Trichogramma brassicae TaxID=86971 RepID=A0A6H5J377_9HYME|nr:unnamed protein product [Trichogramma brassicae]